jgi:5-methylcytosine-specific restriction endonuclease McrA
MQTISRKAAKAAGLKHYFTGKPCKRGGHIDKRYVASFACATCVREKAYDDFQRWDEHRKERQREYNKRRWQDPEFRKRMRRYQQHPVELQKQRARNREWKKANRASCTDRQNKRNAILRDAFVEDVSLAELFERDNGRCQICGHELSMDTRWPNPHTPTRDHIVPLSKGGTHERSNLQLACAVCNVRKGNRCA